MVLSLNCLNLFGFNTLLNGNVTYIHHKALMRQWMVMMMVILIMTMVMRMMMQTKMCPAFSHSQTPPDESHKKNSVRHKMVSLTLKKKSKITVEVRQHVKDI